MSSHDSELTNPNMFIILLQIFFRLKKKKNIAEKVEIYLVVPLPSHIPLALQR